MGGHEYATRWSARQLAQLNAAVHRVCGPQQVLKTRERTGRDQKAIAQLATLRRELHHGIGGYLRHHRDNPAHDLGLYSRGCGRVGVFAARPKGSGNDWRAPAHATTADGWTWGR